jgi:hypothetical protein
MEMAWYVHTDFGAYPVPQSVATILDESKKRADGRLDERTAAGVFMRRYERLANLVAEKAFVCGCEPLMPEASDA